MKRIIATLLTLILAFTSYSYSLNDLPSDWARKDIDKLRSYHLLREEAFGNYQDNITRSDFVYLAVRLYELMDNREIVVDPDISFSDTEDIYALKGATVGIISTDDGEFGPNNPISRERLTTLLVKILKLQEIEIESFSVEAFKDDTSFSDWAKESIYIAKWKNIIGGVNDNEFDAKAPASREVALMATNRVIDNYKEMMPSLNGVKEIHTNNVHIGEVGLGKYNSKVETLGRVEFERDLEVIVNKTLSKYDLEGDYGLYIQELKTGYDYGINDKKVTYNWGTGAENGYFNAASVVKLLLAFSTYKMSDEGIFDLDAEYVEPVNGYHVVLNRDLSTMIRISSNEIHNYVIRLVHQKDMHHMTYIKQDDGRTKQVFVSKINDILADYGFPNLKVHAELQPAAGASTENNYRRYGMSYGGRVNPYELGQLLKYIYFHKDDDPKMDKLHTDLKNITNNSRIPRGLNYSVPVAHKTGTFPEIGTYNDAAIVHLEGNPYIMVGLTYQLTEWQAYSITRELAANINEYMKTRIKKNGEYLSLDSVYSHSKFLPTNRGFYDQYDALKELMALYYYGTKIQLNKAISLDKY